ncbi:MAG: hypothetical protein B6D56_03070 [Candidatus Omnitrophica bacterium 4484_70.1]|nr:MAG: hypothetical protein B6D56_03070 [Candidatus Omnitrophica bacterium 4484_70.1]
METELRGVNLGGWLLMEGYILGGRNIPEKKFKALFKRKYKEEDLEEFERLFRNSFIQEDDFARIKEMGANCVRVPFHYRLLEEAPFRYTEEGFSYLKKALRWAKKYNLKVILDLHAACGSQNEDWHSDSVGFAYLWKKEVFRQRTYRLWEEIVSLFKDEEALFGYDILNEPVTKDIKTLLGFYKELIGRIKAIDKEHIIFVEGNLWATEIDFLESLLEEKVYISIHFYQPLDFTFNFVPYLKYPGKIGNILWNKDTLYQYILKYYKFAQRNRAKIFVGEFGVNWRENFFGEGIYLEDLLDIFEEFGFDYTYWTYKTVKNYIYPDGLFQYLGNQRYVRRESPSSGWESYLERWREEKYKIKRVWDTRNYTLIQGLYKILEKYFKRNR